MVSSRSRMLIRLPRTRCDCQQVQHLVTVFLLVLWVTTCMGQVCPAYFYGSNMDAPLPLPAAVQLEPTVIPNWQNYWEVLNQDDQPLACLLMEDNGTNTIIQSTATSCHNVTQWDNIVTWPSFVRGGETWYNLYTMYLFASSGGITAQLNQQKGNGLTQDTEAQATAMNRVNMTTGGPKMKLPHLQTVDSCLAMTGCDQGWSDLSLAPSDTIFLLPEFSEQVEVRVTLSSCFQEYHIGIYNTSASSGDILRLEVSYSRGDRYHTLVAKLNSKVIISITVNHYSHDCRGEWYLVGVKGARVTPNCPPKKEMQRLVHNIGSFSVTAALIPEVILCSLIVVISFQ